MSFKYVQTLDISAISQRAHLCSHLYFTADWMWTRNHSKCETAHSVAGLARIRPPPFPFTFVKQVEVGCTQPDPRRLTWLVCVVATDYRTSSDLTFEPYTVLFCCFLLVYLYLSPPPPHPATHPAMETFFMGAQRELFTVSSGLWQGRGLSVSLLSWLLFWTVID